MEVGYFMKRKSLKTLCKAGLKAVACALLALTLAVSNLVGLYPDVKVHAAGSDKSLQMVTNATAANIEGAQVSTVYFGTYKQSSDGSNGFNTDPIRWKILANANGKLFLLSYQNLDVVPFRRIVNGE